MGTNIEESRKSRLRDKQSTSSSLKESQKATSRDIHKGKKESKGVREKLKVQTKDESGKPLIADADVKGCKGSFPEPPTTPPSVIASILSTDGSQDSLKENNKEKDNKEAPPDISSKPANKVKASCQYALIKQVCEKEDEKERKKEMAALLLREKDAASLGKIVASPVEQKGPQTMAISPKRKRMLRNHPKASERHKSSAPEKTAKTDSVEKDMQNPKPSTKKTNEKDPSMSGRTKTTKRSSSRHKKRQSESPPSNSTSEELSSTSTPADEQKICEEKQPAPIQAKKKADSPITKVGIIMGSAGSASSSDSDQSGYAVIRPDVDSLSCLLRQNSSSETNLVNNLTPETARPIVSTSPVNKGGILKNGNSTLDGGSRLPRTEEEPCSESAATTSATLREPQLDEDMIVLSEAFHLDENTQSMLAQYDARTVEDFCLMTPEDLDLLVQDAAYSNRPLPPLQIRKVQVLREWAHNLADQSARQAELQALCTYATGIVSEQPRGQYASLIPHDWATQFREDLPRLKQMLKERGQRTAAAGVAWLGLNCLPFPLTCGF